MESPAAPGEGKLERLPKRKDIYALSMEKCGWGRKRHIKQAPGGRKLDIWPFEVLFSTVFVMSKQILGSM